MSGSDLLSVQQFNLFFLRRILWDKNVVIKLTSFTVVFVLSFGGRIYFRRIKINNITVS